MADYKTEQARVLFDFMKKHCDASYSVDLWISEMKRELSESAVPGRSTVFRNMQKLVEHGLVIRSSNASGRVVTYQLAQCGDCDNHLHLKCTECGRLIHLSHEASHSLTSRAMNEDEFDISMERTLIYGKCKSCKCEKKELDK